MTFPLVAAFAVFLAAPAQDYPSTTVGMPAEIHDLVLPGPELEAAPRETEDVVVVRVLATWPHGTAFRYDLEFWAQEPGEHDLTDYLRPKPGAAAAGAEPVDLPPVIVQVETLLPPGQIQPHAPEPGDVPALGGYRALGIAFGILWVAGLLAILFVGRKKREDDEIRATPPTLAERLRPLVEGALRGELSRSERAGLELGLVAYWRRKLDLEGEPPAAALARMREHAEAGPLLKNLEAWLHDPAPALEVDVAALLAPYRDLPPDAMELPVGSAAGAAQNTR